MRLMGPNTESFVVTAGLWPFIRRQSLLIQERRAAAQKTVAGSPGFGAGIDRTPSIRICQPSVICRLILPPLFTYPPLISNAQPLAVTFSSIYFCLNKLINCKSRAFLRERRGGGPRVQVSLARRLIFDTRFRQTKTSVVSLLLHEANFVSLQSK